MVGIISAALSLKLTELLLVRIVLPPFVRTHFCSRCTIHAKDNEIFLSDGRGVK